MGKSVAIKCTNKIFFSKKGNTNGKLSGWYNHPKEYSREAHRVGVSRTHASFKLKLLISSK